MGRRGNGERRAMTADEARTFDRFSTTNASMLAAAAEQHGCQCEPYADWYTYARWQAQGMQVQKGEHGVKLGVIIHNEKRETDEQGQERITAVSRPWTTTVFCRCQVQAKAQA